MKAFAEREQPSVISKSVQCLGGISTRTRQHFEWERHGNFGYNGLRFRRGLAAGVGHRMAICGVHRNTPPHPRPLPAKWRVGVDNGDTPLFRASGGQLIPSRPSFPQTRTAARRKFCVSAQTPTIVIPAKRSPCAARAGTPLYFNGLCLWPTKRGSKSPITFDAKLAVVN